MPSVTPGYQRVGGPEIGGTFEVPIGWTKDELSNDWREFGNSPVSVGVTHQTTLVADDAFFPELGRVTAERPLSLGWGGGTEYVLDLHLPPAAGGAILGRAVHVVVKLDGHTYDLSSQAPADEIQQRKADLAREHLLATFVPGT